MAGGKKCIARALSKTSATIDPYSLKTNQRSKRLGRPRESTARVQDMPQKKLIARAVALACVAKKKRKRKKKSEPSVSVSNGLTHHHRATSNRDRLGSAGKTLEIARFITARRGLTASRAKKPCQEVALDRRNLDRLLFYLPSNIIATRARVDFSTMIFRDWWTRLLVIFW